MITYCYSNNGLSWRAVADSYTPGDGEVVFQVPPTTDQLTAAFPGYAVAAATLALKQAVIAAVAAGIQIVSTGTSALDGTYAIDTASKANIDGIYAGIKNGDGLPGGGDTFNYADISGAMHTFGPDNFLNFARAARDYLYHLSQGSLPSLPITIP